MINFLNVIEVLFVFLIGNLLGKVQLFEFKIVEKVIRVYGVYKAIFLLNLRVISVKFHPAVYKYNQAIQFILSINKIKYL